jgi:hypothetical protein
VEVQMPKMSLIARPTMLVCLLLLIALPSSAISGKANKVDINQSSDLQFTINFPESNLTFDKYNEYDIAQIAGCQYTNELGKPALPIRYVKIALPYGIAANQVRIIEVTQKVIPGIYNILPAQPPITVGSDDPAKFVEPDPGVYSSSAIYPQIGAKLTHQGDLYGQGLATVCLYPVQYIPSGKRLILYTSITFRIECTGGYIYGDYLPNGVTDTERKSYESIVRDIVINPNDVSLNKNPIGTPTIATLPSGTYKHVIITTNNLASAFQPLVNWNTKRGLKDTIVTREWICANYTGDSTYIKIRAFIIAAYSNWSTRYVLLGGEPVSVPDSVPLGWKDYNISGNTPSDQCYGDFDNDWDYELAVGRISAADLTEATRVVNKILSYEKNPPLTNYAKNITLLGMNCLSTQTENLQELIDTAYIDGYTYDNTAVTFNVTKIYESDPPIPSHHSVFVDALNAGQNLINHSDHGNSDNIGTGAEVHDSRFWGYEIPGLINYNKFSIITSIACYANIFDQPGDCIAEDLILRNDLTAGLAFIGNTRLGKITYGQSGWGLSGLIDQLLWQAIFDNNYFIIGEALSQAKNNYPVSSGSTNEEKHCHWEFNLLGEPALPIWTDDPKILVVTHPDLFVTNVSYTIHVTESDGTTPVNKARICLWEGSEIYIIDSTNSNGDFTITPPSVSSYKTLYITVTKQNYIPN